MTMRKTKENTRNKIIDAAKTLFIEKGVNETTIQSIARKAGVDRKTVYNNFADKEDILKVLANDYSTTKLNFDVEVHDLSGMESLKRYMNFMFDHLLLYRELMMITSQLDDSNPNYHIFVGAKNHERLKENLIYQFVEKGLKDESIDLNGLAIHEFMILTEKIN
ncbi:MAG: TetR/AcrR family transcriptional regulator [Clostridia bacterium]|nr:TetR/AcrR family transcriptional regulator [Clostridia bacterium]